MKPLSFEWIEKAEGDFVTTQRELKARRFPNYDAACFHAQQMAEKYLKAFLQETYICDPAAVETVYGLGYRLRTNSP